MIPMQTAVQLSVLYTNRTRMTDALTYLSENNADLRFGIVIYQGNENNPRFAETLPLIHATRFLQERIDWINGQIRLLGGEV